MVIADKNNFRAKPMQCETMFEKISEIQAKQIWKVYLEDKTEFPKFKLTSDYTWILCKITKGKRHQIRLHLSAIGYPIVNDKLYSRFSLKEKNSYHQLYAIGIKF